VTKTEGLDDTLGSANHREGTPFSVSVVGPPCPCAPPAENYKTDKSQFISINSWSHKEPRTALEVALNWLDKNPENPDTQFCVGLAKNTLIVLTVGKTVRYTLPL